MADVTTLLAGIKTRATAALDYPGHVTVEQSQADVPRIVAAIEAVARLHEPLDVFEYDDANGVFMLDEDGEQILMNTFCRECTPDDVLERIGDCEYVETLDSGEVSWPCPTITAVVAALGGGE